MGMGRFVSQVRALVSGRRRRRSQSLEDASRASSAAAAAAVSQEVDLTAAATADPDVAKLLSELSARRAERTSRDARAMTAQLVFRGRSVFVRDVSLELVPNLNGNPGAAAVSLRRARSLLHPHLSRVLLAGVANGRLIIASERAKESVQSKIDKSRSVSYDETLTQADVLQISLAVCDAAAFLHAQGVYGLRLRPHSVLVSEDGTYRLADSCLDSLLSGAVYARHGLRNAATVTSSSSSISSARDVQLSGQAADLERELIAGLQAMPNVAAGTARSGFDAAAAAAALYGRTFPVGSSVAASFESEEPEYMSPEELSGVSGDYSGSASDLSGLHGGSNGGGGVVRSGTVGKSDVFTFGVLLWQLLHLQRPWHPDMGPPAILKALVAGYRPHIDISVVGMDSPLRRILQACWASDPAARPGFAELQLMLIITQQLASASAARDAGAASDTLQRKVRVRSRGLTGVDGGGSVGQRNGSDGVLEMEELLVVSEQSHDEDEDEPPPPPIPPRPHQKQKQQQQQGPSALVPPTLSSQFRVKSAVFAWDPQQRDFITGVVRSLDVRRGLLCVLPYCRSSEAWVTQACAVVVDRELVPALLARGSAADRVDGQNGTPAAAAAATTTDVQRQRRERVAYAA